MTPRRAGGQRLANHGAGQKPLASSGVLFLTPEGVRYVDAERSQGVVSLAEAAQGERNGSPPTSDTPRKRTAL